MGILSLGWDRPLGGGVGPSGWDWWAGAAAIAVFLLFSTARRRAPLAVRIGLALVLGLVLADLTHAWGVVPVWGTLLLVASARNLLHGWRRRHV